MHVSDGILPAPVWAGGLAAASVAAGLVLRRFDERRIPQTAVLASLFFIASSIRLPLPSGSVHLILNGLLGVVLGCYAIPAILLSVFLQAVLLGHGGLTTLGVNTVTMAGGAVAAGLVFRARRLLGPGRRPGAREALFGLLASAAALAVTGLLYLAVMVLSDPAYVSYAVTDLAFHAPLLVIEPPLTAFAAAFLARVKPDLLDGERRVP